MIQYPYTVQVAFKEHAKKATCTYQSGYIRGQYLIDQPELLCPSKRGWSKEGDRWTVVWTTLEPIPKSFHQLNKCGCKKAVEYANTLKCIELHTACSCVCQISQWSLVLHIYLNSSN